VSKVTGYWGVLDNIYETGSARFDALKAAAARAEQAPLARRAVATQAGLLAGTAAVDTLTGSDGNDTIDGGANADRMTGGKGNDTYIVDHARDTTTEFAGGGIDLVKAGITHTLASEVENLTLTGTAAIDGTGNAAANYIVGNAAANRLLGLAGNDTIEGGAGNDHLDGGDGNDMLSGGAGADTLIGGNGNDTLTGAGGSDSMIGGKGDDVYILDNAAQVVVELPGGGIDLIRSTLSTTLSASVENLTLIGTGLTGTGNDSNNVMNFSTEGSGALFGLGGRDTLTGSAGDDTLDGGADKDTLIGGDGDDVLIGGEGADRMTGGDGADRFVIRQGETGATGSAGDAITDFDREQGDRIDLSGWDAITATKLDDPFKFIGTDKFSKVAGELRFRGAGAGTWIVEGDTNGDGVVDLYMSVTSQNGALVANDFVL
jgi:Ca2+-binding RTX toxin-like protein